LSPRSALMCAIVSQLAQGHCLNSGQAGADQHRQGARPYRAADAAGRADEVRSTRRLPLRGAEDRTWTLSGGRPPAFNRAAMASAARKLSPTELVVLISTSSW
jgi:hypothetical protein